MRLAGDRVFSLERGGGQKQLSLVVRPVDEPAAAARLLVDPAALSADAATAIDWYHPSPDGRLVAYGVSEGGDERSVLRVLDVETRKHLGDEIPETRAASVAWLPDGTAFLYSRYPVGDQYNRRVYRHRLGEPWADDELVWAELPTPETWADVATSPDGRFALVTALVGWSRTDLHLRDEQSGEWRTLIEGVDAITYARFDGTRLVAVTTLDAPRGRVVAIPLDRVVPAEEWTTLVPEGAGVIQHAEPVAGGLLVVTTHSAAARITRHAPDGAVVGEVALPELCSVVGLDGGTDRSLAFVQLEGFTRPASLFRWSGGARWRPTASTITTTCSTAQFAVAQERYPSADGTEIGLFLIHRADEPPDVDTPCILTGYGGFAIAETPAWSPTIAAWAEAGGLFAVAGLRGGYEEGEAWHQAGRREHKQQVFDDFHAAADYLVASQRTSRDRLAIRGGSNGGLLVGVGHDPAARPVPSRALRRPPARHGALPAVPHRPALDGRVRRPRRGRGARLVARLLAVPPRQGRRLLPGRAADHGRGRQPGRPAPRPQDGGRAAGRQLVPARPPDPAAPGVPRRSRPGQAAAQAGRRAGRRARVLHLAARRRGRDVTRLAELVVSAEPQAWRDAGFAVDDEGVSQVGLVRLRLDPATWPMAGCGRGHSPPRPTPG